MRKKLPKMKFSEDIPAEEAVLSEHDQGAQKAAQAGDAQSAGQQIARATGTVMIAFIVVSLIGVVHQMVITRVFGVSASLDSSSSANGTTSTASAP